MKVGIMQPYFFPYIGYWQLMNAVDIFVVYDDVNYIKKGWINRNRILINNESAYFNVPILGSSQNKLINNISVNYDMILMKKLLNKIRYSYSKAPYFKDIYSLIENIIYKDSKNIADYLIHSFKIISDYLDIDTKLILSSDIEKDNNLKGQDKIIQMCKIIKADEYYNLIGGISLYNKNIFRNNNIKLSFIKTNDIEYRQFSDKFEPNLSIIDVMMFNSKENVKKMLEQYTII